MNDIKQAFLNSEEVQRLKELESILDYNKTLTTLINQLKEKQKQMVNAKEFHQQKQYEVFKQEYKDLYDKVIAFPFVEEYLELLENVNFHLQEVCNIIENKINSI